MDEQAEHGREAPAEDGCPARGDVRGQQGAAGCQGMDAGSPIEVFLREHAEKHHRVGERPRREHEQDGLEAAGF